MGNGMCSRKQKRILQTLLLLTVVFGFLYGAMLYYELQTQLQKAEAVALKYQQHQESLSAQLQGTVVSPSLGSARPTSRLGKGESPTPGRGVRLLGTCKVSSVGSPEPPGWPEASCLSIFPFLGRRSRLQ